MNIPIETVYLPEEKRLRSEYGDLQELASAMETHGFLQDILVRPLKAEEFPDANGCPWVLVDGARRYKAAEILRAQGKAARGLEPGIISVKESGDVDPLFALMCEFHANEDRKEFTWKEKALYVERVHQACVKHAGGEQNWTHMHTGGLLKLSPHSVYEYLNLAKDKELLEVVEIAEASGVNAAKKKIKIHKDQQRRKANVAHHEAKIKERGERVISPELLTLETITLGDLRDYFPKLDDDTFDWAHWDPPYGAEQRGGSHSAHERIDDSEEYSRELMEYGIGQLYRVMKDGSWLALWFHPSFYASVYDMLSEAGFWVNPYPCIWYKPNRKADGHEITRFLTNAYESFFLASKGDDAALPLSSPQNVFLYDMPLRDERHHVMHKPSGLIQQILEVISVPGEMGIDPSFGSGSSIVAAYSNKRRARGCEISEGYFATAFEKVSAALAANNISHP